jgi:broad specificity phosphatase PhoE
MPLTNATILLVRHGEKDDPCAPLDDVKHPHLNAAGQARAQAYVDYFTKKYKATTTSGRGGDSAPIKLTHLFAAANSPASHRPYETLEPLANATGLPFDYTSYADAQWSTLATDLAHGNYDGANILICWHHGEIICLATDLVGQVNPPPTPESCWPPGTAAWDCDEFGWVMQIRYDGTGAAESDWVRVVNESLMSADKNAPPDSNDWPKRKKPCDPNVDASTDLESAGAIA